MSLSVDALRAFAVLSEELHFGRAATRLHLSQPALTKQIKRLENELGGALFERTTGFVRLSPVGVALKDRCRILVADATAFESYATRVTRGDLGNLRIGMGIAVATDILPRAILGFRKTNPNIILELQDLGSQLQAEMLLDGRLDLGFVRMPITDRRLDSMLVLKEEIQLVVPSGRFEAPPTLKTMFDESFVLIAHSTSETFQRHAFALCAEAGFAPSVVLEAKEIFTVLNLVRAGVGISLVPSTAKRMHVPGIHFFPLRMPSARWDIALAWRKDRLALVQKFVKSVLATIHD